MIKSSTNSTLLSVLTQFHKVQCELVSVPIMMSAEPTLLISSRN